MSFTRRTCLAGLGALAALGGSSPGAGASTSQFLPRRILGRTGLSVSAVGFVRFTNPKISSDTSSARCSTTHVANAISSS